LNLKTVLTLAAFCLCVSIGNVPLPIPGKIDALAALQRQMGNALHVITMKLKRGTFAATFFLACLAAMELEGVVLDKSRALKNLAFIIGRRPEHFLNHLDNLCLQVAV
jgi:hypothetical protein